MFYTLLNGICYPHTPSHNHTSIKQSVRFVYLLLFSFAKSLRSVVFSNGRCCSCYCCVLIFIFFSLTLWITSSSKIPACCNVAGGMMKLTGAFSIVGDVAVDEVVVAVDTAAGDVAATGVSDGDADGLAVSDDVDFVLFFPPIWPVGRTRNVRIPRIYLNWNKINEGNWLVWNSFCCIKWWRFFFVHSLFR